MRGEGVRSCASLAWGTFFVIFDRDSGGLGRLQEERAESGDSPALSWGLFGFCAAVRHCAVRQRLRMVATGRLRRCW